MTAPSIRKSRTIRARLAKRKAPTRVRRIELSRDGLDIDGVRIPSGAVSAEVDIERWRNAALVGVRIFADEVKVRGPFKRGVTITERWAA